MKIIMSFSSLATLVGCGLALVPMAHGAQILTNGGFESGFTGWGRADALGSAGTFSIQTGTASPVNADPVPLPPGGTNAAMSDGGGPGGHVLWQNFTVGAVAGQVLLSFNLYIGNRAELFATPSPATLDFGINAANQQVRVDILSGTAGNFSVAASDVLLNLYQSQPGNALVSGYNTVNMNITSLVNANLNSTLRLRFAETDNLGQLQLGVDNVIVDVQAAQAVPEPASILMMAGGLCAAIAFSRRRRL
jgi:hypothetical protein